MAAFCGFPSNPAEIQGEDKGSLCSPSRGPSDHKSHKSPCQGQVTPWWPVFMVCYCYSRNFHVEYLGKHCPLNGHRPLRGGTHISAKEGGNELKTAWREWAQRHVQTHACLCQSSGSFPKLYCSWTLTGNGWEFSCKQVWRVCSMVEARSENQAPFGIYPLTCDWLTSYMWGERRVLRVQIQLTNSSSGPISFIRTSDSLCCCWLGGFPAVQNVHFQPFLRCQI